MKLYKIKVSSINVKSRPSSNDRNVHLYRDTIVTPIGPPALYKNEQWLYVETVSKPIVRGYVQAKYLSRL